MRELDFIREILSERDEVVEALITLGRSDKHTWKKGDDWWDNFEVFLEKVEWEMNDNRSTLSGLASFVLETGEVIESEIDFFAEEQEWWIKRRL